MLCLYTMAGLMVASLAGDAFTLAWTHSVEKVAWEEDWRLSGKLLTLTEARVQGSGAGMEPPSDAVLRDGWWRYRPELPAQKRLVLARSGVVEDYRLCQHGACRSLGELHPVSAPTATILAACP